ncbi:MAG: hypothetical protein DRJ28_01085 [Actinobacteria bacterium]|nr:MAG: hypothetical protein DRJ28_01085 [Actinomycetota bacterium]
MVNVDYEHTQHGYTGILTAVFTSVILWTSLPPTFAESPSLGVLIALSMVSIVALTFWFSRLVVTVIDGSVAATFGLGKPHRIVQLSDVVDARQVRNHWIQGWGVRRVSRGWMYNVWGLDAVELELTSGNTFRIGTNEPDRLHTAILLNSHR